MNTTIDLSHFTTFEDTEVEGIGCCHSVVRSNSAKNIALQVSPSLNNSKTRVKEKGIKLTHHHSLNSLSNSFHPTLKLGTPRMSNNTSLQVDTIKSSKEGCRPQKSPSIKLFVTKKCQAYKNKKVRQHNQNYQLNVKPYLQVDKPPAKSPVKVAFVPKVQPEVAPQLLLTAKKTEGNKSTQRNTPRNLQESEYIHPSSEYLEIVVNEVDKLEFTPSESIIYESTYQPTYQKSSIVVSKKGEKTLQRLYQKQIGKKMEIMESQMSQPSEADVVSIAESFDWRERF